MRSLFYFNFIVLLSCYPLLAYSDSEIPALTLKPKECVVLEQGDKCYVTMKLEWQSGEAASYCLYRSPGSTKLRCWENVTQGNFKEKLAVTEDIVYQLKEQESGQVKTQITLGVSWVHEKQSRPIQTWRLF